MSAIVTVPPSVAHKSSRGALPVVRRLLTAVTTAALPSSPHRFSFPSYKGDTLVKRSNRLVILVGVLLAVLAFVAIVILLNQDGTRDPAGPTQSRRGDRPGRGRRTSPSATSVTPDMVETTEIPVAAVQSVPSSIRRSSPVEPALFALPAGAQVTERPRSVPAGPSNIEAQLLAVRRPSRSSSTRSRA